MRTLKIRRNVGEATAFTAAGIASMMWLSIVFGMIATAIGWVGHVIHVATNISSISISTAAGVLEIAGCVIPPLGAILFWFV